MTQEGGGEGEGRERGYHKQQRRKADKEATRATRSTRQGRGKFAKYYMSACAPAPTTHATKKDRKERMIIIRSCLVVATADPRTDVLSKEQALEAFWAVHQQASEAFWAVHQRMQH